MGTGGLTIFHAEASAAWGGQELRILAELEGLARRGSRTGLLCEREAAHQSASAGAGCPVYPCVFAGAPIPWPSAASPASCGTSGWTSWRPTAPWMPGWGARGPLVRRARGAHPTPGPSLKRNPLSRMVYRRLADAIVVTGASGGARLIADAGVPRSGCRWCRPGSTWRGSIRRS